MFCLLTDESFVCRETVIHDETKKYFFNDVISWSSQSAKALHYLHSEKHIHRDVKPQNMLLDSTGKILKICDFGLSREINSYAKTNAGTRIYIAPEIMKGQPYNEKCDIYSWALTIWECFVRRKPFYEYSNDWEFMRCKCSPDYRLNDIDDMPPEINELIQNCSSSDPDNGQKMRSA